MGHGMVIGNIGVNIEENVGIPLGLFNRFWDDLCTESSEWNGGWLF